MKFSTMKFSTVVGCAGLLSSALAGCGGSDDTGAANGAFNPPAAPQGYQRFVAPVIADIGPGTDLMYCQYVQAPLDHDVDILDVRGFQSKTGHHAVAYSVPGDHPVGSSGPCTADENLAGGFIGGVGGEGTGGTALPPGVAFRLPKGNAIMLNVHFLNVTRETIAGESVLDIKFAPVDPSRKVASLFTNVDLGFRIAPGAPGQSVGECKFPREMDLLSFSNHMHDYGTHAKSEIIRAGSTEPELLLEDPTWAYEMQFKPTVRQWTTDTPLHVNAGDVMKTHCYWNNPTSEELHFPREMCVGVAFFISDGSTSSSPICVNGAWLEKRPDGL